MGQKATGPILRFTYAWIAGSPVLVVNTERGIIMRKLNSLIIVCVLGIALIPGVGIAELSLMTDNELREVTGQGGIQLVAEDQIDFDMTIKTAYYGDDDGTDGTPAYLSLNDVSLKGSATFDSPVSLGITTELDPYSNTQVTGINVEVSGMNIDIDHFTVGSITVGSAPGEGKSFGSFGIYDYHARISGKIRITTN
jgi:hypothetical protein